MKKDIFGDIPFEVVSDWEFEIALLLGERIYEEDGYIFVKWAGNIWVIPPHNAGVK